MSAVKKKTPQHTPSPPANSGGARKLIASNPQAKRNFVLSEFVEAGLVLTGTEVKSLRQQAPNLKDAFVQILAVKNQSGAPTLEAWLLNTHIAPYSHGNISNHDPLRKRKLLLHRRQITKLFGYNQKKGMTLIPTQMYFLKGRAKIEIGVGKGKKAHDKRESMKERSAQREMEQSLKKRKV